MSASSLLFLCWQLPTYDGTKSYQNLLVEVYGGQYADSSTGINKADSFLQQLPTSFIRSGRYNYDSGDVDARNYGGDYWESDSYSTASARYLYLYSIYLFPQRSEIKGTGRSLRCLIR